MAAPPIHSTTAPAAGLASTANANTIIGDLVVVITWERAGAGVPDHSIEAGYTEIFSQPHNDGSTDGRLSVAYKVATAAGAQSYQAYTSSVGTETWTGLLVLDAGGYDPALIFRAAGVTGTTSGAPNPPAVGTAITSTAPLALNDYLMAAISAWHLGSSLTLTPTHSVYTLRTDVAGAATGDVALATIARTAFQGSEDPGAYADNQTPNGTSSITIAFGAPPAFGALRQRLFTNAFTSGAAAAYPQSVQAGSLLIAAFGRETNSTPTVTDSQGNTWASARVHYNSGIDWRDDLWYAIAGSTGACSVTVTCTGTLRGGLTIAEYQGPFHATPLDVVTSAQGTSAAPSSGNVTPNQNGTLFVGYVDTTGTTAFTPGTDFVADDSQPAGTNADTLLESFVQTTAAAHPADCTTTGSAAWSALVATFKPPASALPIEEESDAWWAGAARCFVAVPLAGAVTALALSASLAWGYQQQTEDIVPQPPTVEEDYWSAPVVVEETRLLSLWTSSGAASAPPPVFAPAEEPNPLACVRPASAAPSAFPLWADDDLPAAFVPDEDTGGLLAGPSRPVTSSLGPAWAVDDDLVPPPAAFPPEEDSWVPLRPCVAISAAVWAVDDEIVPQPAPGIAGEDLGPLPTPRVVAARPLYLPDPESLPAGVLFGVPEEDTWSLPLARPARPTVAVAVADDDIVPQPLFEDDAWGWPPSSRIIPPVGTLWAVDEPIVPIPMPTEDYWQAPVIWHFRPVPVAMVADDEIAFVASSITLLRVADEVAGRSDLIGALPQSAGQAGHIHMTDETGV